MSKRALKSLSDCLFDMFANEDFTDPQAEENRWALYEGINRIDSHHYEWQSVKAHKDHECIRGHEIKAGQIYFKRGIGAGWGSEWKFCAGCMAMVLYFKEVDKLPIAWYTHWDFGEKRAVNVSKQE